MYKFTTIITWNKGSCWKYRQEWKERKCLFGMGLEL